MFTGLIEARGRVVCREGGAPMRAVIALPPQWVDSLSGGASVACDGVCLTVTKLRQVAGELHGEFDIGAATIANTTAGDWQAGDTINLERSLAAGAPMGGHMVSGHVDGTARVESVEESGGCRYLRFGYSDALRAFVAAKGSVAVNGVSLTVESCAVSRYDAPWFRVMLVPATLSATNLSAVSAGSTVNLEVDLMARYVVNAMQHLDIDAITNHQQADGKPR